MADRLADRSARLDVVLAFGFHRGDHERDDTDGGERGAEPRRCPTSAVCADEAHDRTDCDGEQRPEVLAVVVDEQHRSEERGDDPRRGERGARAAVALAVEPPRCSQEERATDEVVVPDVARVRRQFSRQDARAVVVDVLTFGVERVEVAVVEVLVAGVDLGGVAVVASHTGRDDAY